MSSLKVRKPLTRPAEAREEGLGVKKDFRSLAEELCEEHRGISTYQGIFGGVPHLKNVRLSVTDVLSQLYVLGSIEAVVAYYAPDISAEQVKEAIAYAHDFMERACEPSQAHD